MNVRYVKCAIVWYECAVCEVCGKFLSSPKVQNSSPAAAALNVREECAGRRRREECAGRGSLNLGSRTDFQVTV